MVGYEKDTGRYILLFNLDSFAAFQNKKKILQPHFLQPLQVIYLTVTLLLVLEHIKILLPFWLLREYFVIISSQSSFM